MNTNGLVSKAEWKKALMRLMPELTGFEIKNLRKQLPKKLKSEGFIAFVDSAVDVVGSGTPSETGKAREKGGLAKLPLEVPQLPPSFKRREHAQQQLLDALLVSSVLSTAVTAPKSRVSVINQM
jgi:hypothetical protein